jgi:CRISPR-associated endonuclease Csn1
MKKILGLDIGTNSIGWAFIDYNESEETGYIHGIGSRIVPMETKNIDEFKKGASITKNLARRTARSERRMRQRYKLRRNKLLQVFDIIMPQKTYLDTETNQFVCNAKTIEEFKMDWKAATVSDDMFVYFLRQKALNDKIDLSELFKVLYHLAQRRGFKSGRLEKNMEKASKTTSNVVIQNVLIKAVHDSGEKNKKAQTKWIITYNDNQLAYSYSKSFQRFIDKELIVKINPQKEEFQISIPSSKESWTIRRDELDKKINESDLTVGSYYYEQLKKAAVNGAHYKIKDRIVQRSRYVDEFNAIWAKQADFHPEIKDMDVRNKVIHAIFPSNESLQQEAKNKNLGEIIRDYIIYYQRPLKSQKKLISECRYEKFHKVTPRSIPIFEEFRSWQQINNVKIYDTNERFVRYLSDFEKSLLYNTVFDKNKEVDDKKIISALKINSNDVIVKLGKTRTLKGNTTRCILRGVLKKYFDPEKQISKGKKSDLEATKTDLFLENHDNVMAIWHILYSIDDEKQIHNAFKSQFPDFSEELITELSDINFEKQYGSISSKACKKLLPLMRAGNYFELNNIHAKTTERITRLMNAEEDERDKYVEDVIKDKLSKIDSIIDCQGLSYWEAASIVYGSHSDKPVEKYTASEFIQPLTRHSLRNPIVEQIVNETLSIVKAVWDTWEQRPDEIRVELSRELRMSADERKSYTTLIEKNEEENKEIKKALKEIENANHLSPSHLLKYKLWLEANKKSPYTGKTIPISLLFTEGYQIEHIIPKTRYFDNSRKNVTVCEALNNDEKSDRIAYQYIKEGGQDTLPLDKFEEHIRATFSKKKANWILQEKIPEGFIERQMKLTEYISVAVKEELAKVAPVQTSTGLVTDMLKEQWGLTRLFKKELASRYENIDKSLVFRSKDNDGRDKIDIEHWDKRVDHRHHALDALAIACATRSHVKNLNDLNIRFEEQQNKLKRKELMQTELKSLRKFRLPWQGFVEQATFHLQNLIVSIKNRKRLLSKGRNLNTVKKEGKKSLHKQTKFANKDPSKLAVNIVRGALHGPNPIGEIRRFEKISSEAYFKKYDRFKNFVAHDWQREVLLKKISKHNDDPKLVLKSIKTDDFMHPNGSILRGDWISLSVPKYVFRRPLNASSTLTQLKAVADICLKDSILKHLVEYGQFPKEKLEGEEKVKNSDTDVKNAIEKAFNEEGRALKK